MKTTLRDLIRKLPVVDENILAEAARQPELFVQAARIRVERMRVRASAEQTFEMHQSIMWIRERLRANNLKGPRLSDAYVNGKVLQYPVIKKLRRRADRAKASEELAKLFLESLRMRRDAIKIIADAQVYEGMRDNSFADKLAAQRRLREEARRMENKRRHVEKDEDD